MSMKTVLSCYEQWLSGGLDVWAYCFVFLQFKRYHSSVNSGERLGIAMLKKAFKLSGSSGSALDGVA